MNEQLTAEDRQIFRSFYQRRVAEAGGARDSAAELEIARDILMAVVNDGLTPTADGGASFVRRGAMDWSDPATVEAAQATTGGHKPRSLAAGGGGGLLEMLQGVGLVLVGLGLAAWFLFFRGGGEKGPVTPTPEPESTVAAVEATATPVPTLEADLLADIVDAGVKTDLVVPRTLEVKGVSFIVQPVKIRAGDWPLPDDERAVSWVYGTVINYALGMEATSDNKALLSSLRPGDELILRMSTGPAYRFIFADLVRVAPQASEIFRQARPGLTLALLADEEQPTRVVLRALYQASSELGLDATAPARPLAVGQEGLLEERLGLVCLGGRPLQLAESIPGYLYLAVDYLLQNRQEDGLLSTDGFVHRLETQGMIYPAMPNGAASELAAFTPLPPELPPAQVVTTTAVYAIPGAALRESLAWHFAASPSGVGVVVELPPYTGTLLPQVTVNEAIFEDGVLSVTFDLVGASLQDIEVRADDFQVEGGTLHPVGNYFPWSVAADSSGQFMLLLSPETDSRRMVVSLLGQGFEFTY